MFTREANFPGPHHSLHFTKNNWSRFPEVSSHSIPCSQGPLSPVFSLQGTPPHAQSWGGLFLQDKHSNQCSALGSNSAMPPFYMSLSPSNNALPKCPAGQANTLYRMLWVPTHRSKPTPKSCVQNDQLLVKQLTWSITVSIFLCIHTA